MTVLATRLAFNSLVVSLPGLKLGAGRAAGGSRR